MLLKLPLPFGEYIDLLLSKGYADTESGVVQELIGDGLVQLLSAISQGGLGDPSEEMDFFKSCETRSFEISDDFPWSAKVKALSERLKFGEELIVVLLVNVGLLTEGYYFLRHEVPEYETEPEYREMVDEMPHYPAFEEKEAKKTFIIAEDEELKIDMIH